MIEKPILFSGPMVRAILEGKKTQTRRVVAPGASQSWLTSDLLHSAPTAEVGPIYAQFTHPLGGPLTCVRIPHPVGTRLWVRETWYSTPDKKTLLGYAADDQIPHGEPYRIRPSIFMPRKFSRINLLVTEVRCQRLQDITEEDARAEGAEPWPFGPEQPMTSGELGAVCPYRGGFAVLWDDINTDRGFTWYSNPWVWAYTFQRILE